MTTTPAIERPPRAYRLVHYHYDPFLGGKFPIGAIVREGDEERFVRAPRMPDLRDYPGAEAHLALVLRWFGPRGPYKDPAPNVYFGDEHAVPATVTDAAAWALDMLAGGKRAAAPLESAASHAAGPSKGADVLARRWYPHSEEGRLRGGRAQHSVCTGDDDLHDDRAAAGEHTCVAMAYGRDEGEAAEVARRIAADHNEVVSQRAATRGETPYAEPPPLRRVQEHFERHGGHWLVTAAVCDMIYDGEPHPAVLRMSVDPGVRYPVLRATMPGYDLGGHIERGDVKCDPWAALRGSRFIPLGADGLPLPAAPDDVLMSVWIGDAVVELERRRRAAPPRRNAAAMTAGERRAETGVVQFGEDWPGVFIRGDVAHTWAHSLSALGVGTGVEEYTDADIASGRAVQLMVLSNLRELLLRPDVGAVGHRVDDRLLPFPACATAASPPLVHLTRAVSALAGLDDGTLDAVTPEAMRRVLTRRGWTLAGVNRLAGDSSVVAFEVHHHDTARAACRQRGTVRSVLLPAVRLADYRLRVVDWCEALASRHGDVAPAVVLAEVLAEVGR